MTLPVAPSAWQDHIDAHRDADLEHDQAEQQDRMAAHAPASHSFAPNPLNGRGGPAGGSAGRLSERADGGPSDQPEHDADPSLRRGTRPATGRPANRDPQPVSVIAAAQAVATVLRMHADALEPGDRIDALRLAWRVERHLHLDENGPALGEQPGPMTKADGRP